MAIVPHMRIYTFRDRQMERMLMGLMTSLPLLVSATAYMCAVFNVRIGVASGDV